MDKLAIAPAALLVLALTACTEGRAGGPMELGGSDAVACIPAEQDLGDGFFFGEWVGNTGTSEIVIDAVQLRDASNFSLVTASSMSVDEAIGAVVDPASSVGWADRVDAVGSGIPPGRHVNVVVQLRLDDPSGDGEAAGFDVHYSDGSRDFVDSSTVVFQVSHDCDAAMTDWRERPR